MDAGLTGTPNRVRAKDREVTLQHLHAVAQADHHPIAAPHTESRQMPGQPPGPRLQIGVRDRPLRVLEGDLPTEVVRVLPQHQGERSDQLGAHGITHPLVERNLIGHQKAFCLHAEARSGRAGWASLSLVAFAAGCGLSAGFSALAVGRDDVRLVMFTGRDRPCRR
ncbi:hypothetical protein Srubr_25410 [Streptomyces rubradiris]|uniref:Uncharacterized protein n=1 Tax=Streptomyces rubradiris TaxID=285531 RepID=A0ABQ3RA20_STRRR|nr:hypothetical protein Srubr_25410 [Streptomyces rubradiris]